MIEKIFNHRTPGRIAFSLGIILTGFWSYWSIAEMYHEGWWGPFYMRLIYLIPMTIFLSLTLVGIKWPRLGGWLVIVFGGLFAMMFLDIGFTDGKLHIGRNMTGILVSVPLLLVGLLFLFEARSRKRLAEEGWTPNPVWWKRNFWYLMAVAPPVLIFIGLSVFYLPIVLTRQDDGDRGARLIEGNGVELIWAPEGPGWNWLQDYGGYPSWNRVALYGLEPVGMEDKEGFERGSGVYASAEEMEKYNLCLYLSEDGLTLMEEPQYIWRMPTVDEYVRTLTKHGENAGCLWNGEERIELKCDRLPDKETPLWNPDLAPIYYWAADELDERDAFYVSYNGWVTSTSKNSGNPRHSYRCVREP